MKLKIILKGGPGSGHHGHAGRPGSRGGSTAGTGGAEPAPTPPATFEEDTIRAYSMMRHASLVPDAYATRVMSSAMKGTAGLSAAQKRKVTTLRKLAALEKKRRSDLYKEKAIIVPSKGPFKDTPMQVRGYAERIGKVTKWRTSPIGSKRKMLDIEVDIPNSDL